jgi:hypothetical protein
MFTGGRVAPLGGRPGPSAKATEANDISKNAIARTRFMVFLLCGEFPGNSLVGKASGEEILARNSNF